MYYHDGKLLYKVEVTTPNLVFAKMLRQTIGIKGAVEDIVDKITGKE